MKLKPVSVFRKMAEVGNLLCEDQISCPVCLDLLKDPVTIPCGHSYCMGCIKGCWDQNDHVGVYSCPQCRQTFTPRPVLNRNTMLAEVVETLKETGLQAAPPAHRYAGPGDVECDVCTGRKRKAAKSCLVCLASYCETHLQPHYDSAPLKKHKLSDTTGQLKNKICSHHDKLLEVYCRTDQQCICYLCMVDEHRGHDTVSAAAERTEKQKQVGATQRKFKRRVQEREKEVQELRHAVDSHKRSAQAAVEDSERIFTELICSIERRRSEVTELIRDQEKAAVSQAEGLLEKLEQEIADLKRRDTELEQLSHTEDHVHFLQSCPSLSVPTGPGHLPRHTVNSCCSFEDLRKTVSELKENLEGICKETLVTMSQTVKKETFLQIPAPRTREDLLLYAYQLTLDPNTAHRGLYLSEGDRKVTWGTEEQPYPDHPERFDWYPQVLCRESLTGPSYWEVQWSGAGAWIGMTYKGISRKGESADCVLGFNDKSWCLSCSGQSYSVYHNNKHTALPVQSSGSHTVGVYVDWEAGTLSFYRVSSGYLTHLYTFTCTFTEPLYPGFRVYSDFWIYGCNSSVSLCDVV